MFPIYASMFLTLLAVMVSTIANSSRKRLSTENKLFWHKISFGICMLSLLLLIIGFFC